MSDFANRFSELFHGHKQREIAETLGVTDAAVRNYLGGRVPDAEKLQLIAEVTKCDLHWLLTGSGEKYRSLAERNVRNEESFDRLLEERIRRIVREEISPVGGEVGPIQWGQEQVGVPHLGTVDGGEVEVEVEKKRKTG